MVTADTLFSQLQQVRFSSIRDEDLKQHIEKSMPVIEEIERLKREKNAVILAHSYVTPDIIYSVADYSGDSYELSKNALEAEADLIVFAAVRFMGETAKILSPHKEVLIPGTDPACSLADSISASDVRRLKEEYPDYAFICYINTTAAVKAECDVSVTSSNVYKIIENYPSDKIYFLPDRLMGMNIIDEMQRRGIKKDIRLWNGTCYVHEEFEPRMIDEFRSAHPDIYVMAHPECKPEVIRKVDYVGSTSQMFKKIQELPGEKVMMLTECGLISRIEVEKPGKKFLGACQMCKYMKSNSLENILRVLKDPRPEDYVQLDEELRLRAIKSLEMMFKYAEG
ncbi:quinolinate synthase NadA [Marispirochaeta aestuarii]|uniref:quinolinate synthase NadA n=1 Tax=Marispirochaeta aestuarii TaxID=1963862 RepID=UPI0029C7209C|nr:quinolinate synthase NadA [Marispirochaeta aestuarii]